MRHFRLNIIITVLVIIAASAALGMLLVAGGHAVPKILLAAVIAAMLVRLMQMVWRLIHQMSFFVSALSNSDFMIRFPKSDDRELCEMFNTMNDIIALYRDNQTEI